MAVLALPYSLWIAVALLSAATLTGAWIARRNSERVGVWLAIASTLMSVSALSGILPDAWRSAAALGVFPWAVPLTAAAGFLVVGLFTRGAYRAVAGGGERGRGGLHSPGRHRRVERMLGAAVFAGMGAAVPLTLHRAVDGTAPSLIATAPVPVALGLVTLALMVHCASEGLALAALLGISRQRLAPWLVLACASPVLGVALAVVHPLPADVAPVVLAAVAGGLLRVAFVCLRLASGRRRAGELSRGQLVSATVAASAVGTLLGLAY
ncbi:hypothetical protein AB0C51_11675 [Streptomyces pathocidini]|nr:hypothetical protein [Streptomyces pathocidini]